jgi:SAM-dependent methyltransferase
MPLISFCSKVAAKLAPGALVVDGGAGNCKHKNFFPHVLYISFDFTPTRKRAYGEIDLSADLCQLPFRKDTFEAAINVEVLEHLKEPKDVLRELYRVLRPGGNLFLVAPQGWQEHGMLHDYGRRVSRSSL